VGLTSLKIWTYKAHFTPILGFVEEMIQSVKNSIAFGAFQ
jgi:hypothetical protein